MRNLKPRLKLAFCIIVMATLLVLPVSANPSDGRIADWVATTPGANIEANQTDSNETSFSFRDDFNYSSLDQLVAAGWTINTRASRDSYLFGDGILTLLNDGIEGAAVQWTSIPTGVSDWTISLRGQWGGGRFGTIQLNVFTTQHVYIWLGDGFRNEYSLGRDTGGHCCEAVFSTPGYQPQQGVWRTLRLDMQAGQLSMYFDGAPIGTYVETDPATDLTAFGTQGSYFDSDSFDFVEAAQFTSQPDFSISADPGSLTIEAGTNGVSTISLGSTGGFTGDVNLTSSVAPPSLEVSLVPLNVHLMPDSLANSTLFVLGSNSTLQGTYLVDVTGTSGSLSHSVSLFVTVIRPDRPPAANFQFSPIVPIVGDSVSFDGSNSTDSDGFVVSWFWSLGDGSADFGPHVFHSYFFPGDYNVTLTVTDNDGATGIASAIVHVVPRPTHDVSVEDVDVYTPVAVSGQFVNIVVYLRNRGVGTETVSLTVYYDSNVIATKSGIALDAVPYTLYVPVIWDTTGVAAGNYTISATVFLDTDENPSNNSFSNGVVTILPPPTLASDPASGGLGTKVQVHGQGFPLPGPYSPFSIVLLSFDDQFLGYALSRDGAFDFTFNVPHAEPGTHLIKAFDTQSGVRTNTPFNVLESRPTPTDNPEVRVQLGSVYFPGDTADIYVLITGAQGDVTLRLTLYKPGGTTATLTASLLGPGVYKASYPIPTTASMGTYAIVVRVQQANGGELSALGSFEVKPSWISVQGPRVASASIALFGIVAVAALAWRRRVSKEKDLLV